MSTILIARLTNLTVLAASTRKSAFPARASLLDILSFLSVADLRQWIEVGEDTSTLRRVGSQVGQGSEFVRNVLTPFLRNDLRDYSAEYGRLRGCFETCGPMQPEVIAWCEQDVRRSPIRFLLHALPHEWNSDWPNLSIILDEAGEEDNSFGDACGGYLVMRGMAFSSSIELLTSSFRSQWAGWEKLWQEFF